MSVAVPPVVPYARAEFTCQGCGAICRVDHEFSAGPIVGRGQHYRHCSTGQVLEVGGPIVAVWEKRDNKWVLLANRKTV